MALWESSLDEEELDLEEAAPAKSEYVSRKDHILVLIDARKNMFETPVAGNSDTSQVW